MTRDDLIEELVRYTRTIDEALEKERDPVNRPHYSGHLAMAARMFVYLHLGERRKKLEQVFHIERMAHAQELPGNAAATTKAAWRSFSLKLAAFLEANQNALPGSSRQPEPFAPLHSAMSADERDLVGLNLERKDITAGSRHGGGSLGWADWKPHR